MVVNGRILARPFIACLLCLLGVANALAQPIPIAPRDDAGEQGEGPKMLDDDQINLIKIYEVQLNTKPRITFSRDDLEEFLREYATDDRVPRGREGHQQFLRAEGYEQLKLMFDVRARDYYGKANYRGEPAPMSVWHRQIHRNYVLEYFREYFGTGQIPAIYLFPQGRDASRIAYTNFYILTQIRVDGVPIIDRDRPEESLLLQWGLPRAEAKFQAPDVPNWEPRFRSTEDERYKSVLAWIKSLVAANQNSNYGLQYTIPKHEPATGGE